MESNKCNRNIRYAIFRESNLTKLSEYLAYSPTFSCTFLIDLAN